MINIEKKSFFLSPKNNMTEKLLIELTRQNKDFEFLGYIDSFKEEKDVLKPNKIEEYDYDLILLLSPIYWKDISKNLPKKDLYVLLPEEYNYKAFSYFLFSKTFLINSYKLFINYTKHFNYKVSFSLRMFIQNRFNLSLSTNIKKLKGLKNIHKGKRAFIIGTGPSLKIEDLEKLEGEITFACNKIFLAYEKITWRPTYYTIEDTLDMKEYFDKIDKNESSINIFPSKFLNYYKEDRNYLYYNNINNKTAFGFEVDPFKGLYGGETVIYSMMQLLSYMGCSEIYLLGIDFDYEIPKKSKGQTYLHSEGEANHFHKDYRKEGDLWTEPKLDNTIEQFHIANNKTKKNNIKIFNATRGGKLEVFQRVCFDDLIRNENID